MECRFLLADETMLDDIFNLFIKRVAWMDKVGIKQWNVTKYDEVYPVSYYEEKRQNGEVFVLSHPVSGEIAACAVLKSEDDRWNTVPEIRDEKAFYLHNFAVPLNMKGAGAVFLRKAEEYAKNQGKKYFRLDSADDNKALESYYSEKGYIPVGECIDGLYKGILRQKEI